jgi:hypothetical protein
MRIRLERLVYSIATVAAIGVAWSIGVHGQAPQGTQQGPAPARFIVTTTQVKPEMVTAYQELIQNEAIPALKKAGVPWRWTFGTGPVGPGFTYVTAQPIPNYASFDQGPAILRALGQEGAAKYNAKLRPMLVSTNSVIQTLIANASLQSFSQTPPPLVTIQTLQLLPGKGPEFATITSTEFLPALKKAGATDYWVFATNFGGSGGERTIVSPASKFADFDQGPPIVRALGAEAAQKLTQKRNALTTRSEITIMRFLPNLSYGAPARPAGTSQ